MSQHHPALSPRRLGVPLPLLLAVAAVCGMVPAAALHAAPEPQHVKKDSVLLSRGSWTDPTLPQNWAPPAPAVPEDSAAAGAAPGDPTPGAVAEGETLSAEALAALRLNLVMTSRHINFAIIDGKRYVPGDVLGGLTLERINSNSVLLTQGNKRHVVMRDGCLDVLQDGSRRRIVSRENCQSAVDLSTPAPPPPTAMIPADAGGQAEWLSFPALNSAAFCRTVGAQSYRMEKICLDGETQARGRLSTQKWHRDVVQQCVTAARSEAGESYQAAWSCVSSHQGGTPGTTASSPATAPSVAAVQAQLQKMATHTPAASLPR
ncbi:MAG: general secretion pathway protein GspB [Magnetococcus sp. WYHC-3]